MPTRLRVLSLIVFVLSSALLPAQTPRDWVNPYLEAGNPEQGIADIEAAMSTAGGDKDRLLFSLGFLQVVDAVDNLGEAFYRHGAQHGSLAAMIPVMRMVVPSNPDPDPISHDQFREVLQTFLDDILKAEATLGKISGDPGIVVLRPGVARIDLDGDGTLSENESLWALYNNVNRRVAGAGETAADFEIALDAGDATWLRAYCNLLAGFLQTYLAHDDSILFENTAHLFFGKPVSETIDIMREPIIEDRGMFGNFGTIADLVAFIHLLRFPVEDASRLGKARQHFLKTIELSRVMWIQYAAETDDDREWLPNSSQTGVLQGFDITPERLEMWQAFLAEMEDVLNGVKLAPYWRGTTGKGIDIKRAFEEPRTLDVILWVQGSAAIPYLEDGPITDPGFWEELHRAFDGNFMMYAVYIN